MLLYIYIFENAVTTVQILERRRISPILNLKVIANLFKTLAWVILPL